MKYRLAALLLLGEAALGFAQTPADAQPGSAGANPSAAENATQDSAGSPRDAADPSTPASDTPVLATIRVSPAVEDSSAAAAADRNDADSTEHLEEVIVTATKRSAAVREIPESIAVLDGADLEKRGVQSLDDIARLVPGVNIATENGISRITIRGISSSNNTNATTGTLFGNVSFTDAFIPVATLDPQPFDMQNVEVLKGPQGTLFGASALNGAIRYVPQAPVLGEFSAKYFAQYTSIEHGSADPIYGAAVNVPAGDTAAFRLVAFNRQSPGYVDNLRLNEPDSNHLHQWGERGILAWQPDEAWNLSLTLASQNSSVNDNNLVDNLDGNLSSDNRPRNSPIYQYYRLADANITRNSDWGQLVSETAFVMKRSHSFLENTRNVLASGAVPLLGFVGGGASDTYTQELRLVSPDDADSRWRWIAGVFASRQDIHDIANLAAGNGVVPSDVDLSALNLVLPGLGDLVNQQGNVSVLKLDAAVRVTEIAAFGELTRKLGDAWELSVGGRLYRTRSAGSNTETGAIIPVLDGSLDSVKTGVVGDKSFNPKVSLVWHTNDNVLSYATISKGFRVGGVQPGATLPTSRTQAPPTFQSDTVWNYEAGVRTTWLDRTLNADLTPFYLRWKNPQTLQYDSTTNINYLDNVGGVESHGVDFQLRWITPYRVLINTSVSWTKTVTTEAFQTGSGNVAQPGTPWPFSPRWQTATTLSYPLNLGRWLITPAITHTYLGKTINDLSYQREIFNYQQLDAMIGVQNTSISWLPELDLSVTNVLDERGLTSDIAQGQVTDASYCQPLTVIARISGTF